MYVRLWLGPSRPVNSSAPRYEQTSSFLAVFLKSGVNVANYLKKCCSCGQPKQNFFKYFSTQPLDFEKMSITNDVCLLLGADELRNSKLHSNSNHMSRHQYWLTLQWHTYKPIWILTKLGTSSDGNPTPQLICGACKNPLQGSQVEGKSSLRCKRKSLAPNLNRNRSIQPSARFASQISSFDWK